MLDALVIGGGASGLACAHALQRGGADVLCLEARSRPGGVIGTLERDGFRFETGPNTLQSSSETFRVLCEEIGLTGRLVVSKPEAKRRFLWHKGALRPLPSGPWSFLRTPLLSPRGKLAILTEPLRKHAPVADDEPEPTFQDFLARRIGPEATSKLAGAFVRGVYAAEISQLGARSAFPKMWYAANEHGGMVRGLMKRAKERKAAPPPPGPDVPRSDLFSFPNGLSELTDTLAGILGPHFRANAKVVQLERGAGAFSVRLASDERLEARRLVLAVPAPRALALLKEAAPDRVDLAPLAAVEHASVVVVHLGLEGARLPDAFGFLVPPTEEGVAGAPRVLGALFPSRFFDGRAPAGSDSVSCIYRASDVEGLDDAGLAQRAMADLARGLGTERLGRRVLHIVQRWEGVIPRYAPGHDHAMQALRTSVARALPGLFLTGACFDGVSVEYCLASGRRIAAEVQESLGVAGGAV